VKNHSSTSATPFWRDKRIIPILLQAIFAVVVLLAGVYFINNAIYGMKQIGINLGFGFLKETASFDIGEKLIEYSASDTFGRAFLVGILNTIRVAVIGIILATILGFIIGVGRLSKNWLVQKISTLYVEIFRNTPLLVQIFIWYFAIFLAMPMIENSYSILGLMFFSNRGAAMPWFELTSSGFIWIIFFIVGLILSFLLWKVRLKQQVETGNRKYPFFWASGSVVAMLVIAWLFTFEAPMHLSLPQLEGRKFMGGYTISPEFAAILIALVVYTASFIAEIVRGGILSVSKGQIEAAKALGLKESTTLRLVTLPQAIRVIIPPVTSQYLNLTKNSSLAAAVAYKDLVGVGTTVLNQTGRAVEVITIMILVYLTLSLFTSLLMNIFNKYTQLVER
jgi:general L-amino acid transport system permease protein